MDGASIVVGASGGANGSASVYRCQGTGTIILKPTPITVVDGGSLLYTLSGGGLTSPRRGTIPVKSAGDLPPLTRIPCGFHYTVNVAYQSANGGRWIGTGTANVSAESTVNVDVRLEAATATRAP